MNVSQKALLLLLATASCFADEVFDYDSLLEQVKLDAVEKTEELRPLDSETEMKLEQIEVELMMEQIIYDYNSFLEPTSISCESSPSTNKKEYAIQREPINPAALGAKKVLSTFFQSCRALDTMIEESTPPLKGVTRVKTGRTDIPYQRKISNLGKYVDSHILLNELDQDPKYPGEMCLDMTKRPPLYGYGSRKLPNKKGEINLFTKGAGGARGNAASQIDCSSFISVALATQGLKANSKEDEFQSLTTRNFKEQLNQKGSCLKNVSFKGNQTILPGDMINLAGTHIVMVDEIGDDPLAIEKFAKKKNCNAISIRDFDFSYIHSGSIKNNYGPSRVNISTHSGGTMFNNLRIAAIKQCQRLVQNKLEAVNSDKLRPNNKFDIIRHKSDDPECKTSKKFKLKNEECVEQCLEEHQSEV